MTSRQSITFAQVKLEIRADPNPARRYSRFLDKLALEYDNRGKLDAWDIWYFSLNTDFCLDSAKHYLEEFNDSVVAYKSLAERRKEARGKYDPDKLRRSFGSLLFYLYAALESFSHEANILYELKLQRRSVSLKRISEELRGRDCKLWAHLEEFLSKPNVQMLREYRDAVGHGYVYPVSGSKSMLLLKQKPKMPIFLFSEINVDFSTFVASSFSNVNEFICDGWRCFSLDELS
jgi:hypothetical protein